MVQIEGCNRIHVTGNAGAGKSILARQLGSHLELPVFSLDSIVWQPGWRKTPLRDRELREHELIARPRWLIEGVSSRVRAAADLVLYLDTPPTICLARATVRMLRHLRHQRPEFPEGCVEWRIYPTVLRIIWRFRSGAGRSITKEAMGDPRFLILSGRRETEAFILGVSAGDPERAGRDRS